MKRSMLLAALVGACAGPSGALDQAGLAGECEGSAGCVDELAAGPLAAGGTVTATVRVATAGAATAVLELVAADENVIEITGHQITGIGTGMSAVLVTEAKGGAVIDFFHIYVAEPDRIELARLGGIGAGADLEGSIELLEDDELTLGVVPFRGPQRLVGTGPIAWSVTGDAVSLLDDGNPERRRVVARRAGTASVTADTMGLTQTLTITVLP